MQDADEEKCQGGAEDETEVAATQRDEEEKEATTGNTFRSNNDTQQELARHQQSALVPLRRVDSTSVLSSGDKGLAAGLTRLRSETALPDARDTRGTQQGDAREDAHGITRATWQMRTRTGPQAHRCVVASCKKPNQHLQTSFGLAYHLWTHHQDPEMTRQRQQHRMDERGPFPASWKKEIEGA